MRRVVPQVFLISSPQINWDAMGRYLTEVSGGRWYLRAREQDAPAGQDLAEFAGRLCYRSWEPGLNPNVVKVRTEQGEYLVNLLASAHGSVLEHINYGFVFHNVSRVLTHELVRHGEGTAISQESLRYVRLSDLPMPMPHWVIADAELMNQTQELLNAMEEFQLWAAKYFDLDSPATNFTEKKHFTSFMRRLAPEGVATGLMWTANVRALRHIIETRTAEGAEEEIRFVFNEVGEIMRKELPALFDDYTVIDGVWIPKYRKV